MKTGLEDCPTASPVSQTDRNANLLVVDDDELIGDLLAHTLASRHCEVVTTNNAADALDIMSNSDFELALVDIQMPGEDGLTLLRKIVKISPDTAVVMMSGPGKIDLAISAIRMGAYDYVTKPFGTGVVETRLGCALERRRLVIENRDHEVHLERLVEERTRELEQALDANSRTYDETIKSLGAALDMRDSETADHSNRVAGYVMKLARASGIRDKGSLSDIEWGAYLHDIGKIGVPDSILLKKGKLTAAERAEIETHSEVGYRLLNKIQFLRGAAELVLCHHESFDGSGYPRGLKGESIPISARLFAVADTVDAMRSDRPYRKALGFDLVVKELKRLSGVQFDPEVVRVFLSLPESEWRI